MEGLNIGAGPRFNINGWEKLDYTGNSYGNNNYKPDINFDLNKIASIPRNPETYDYIYTSHVFEHLLNNSVENILNESYRLLKPNGIIRITCPDYDKLLYMYLNNIKINWDYGNKWNEKWTNFDCFLYNTFTFCHRRRCNSKDKEDIIDNKKFIELLKINKNYVYEYCYEICKKYRLKYPNEYSGNHINWWNKDKLVTYLKNAGFSKIKIFSQNQSYSQDLVQSSFNKTIPQFSIYIEAVKV